MTRTSGSLASRTYTPSELATLHELDPTEREIITEGSIDACVISWFLASQGVQVPVYDVSARIEVPNEALDSLDLSYGKRNLVIAASKELARYTNVPPDSILFIVDADYDRTLSPPPPSEKNLLVTDYTDMEMYCFDPQVLGKYLSVPLRAPQINSQSVLDSIEEALSDLFAVRWFLRHLPESPKIVARISNKFSTPNGRLALNSIGLLRDSVNRSPLPAVRKMTDDDLRAGFTDIRRKLDGDPRLRTRGHDFPVALSYFLSVAHSYCFNADREKFKDAETASATLLACLDTTFLLSKPLFGELLNKFRK